MNNTFFLLVFVIGFFCGIGVLISIRFFLPKINNKQNTYFRNIENDILEFHIAHNEGNYFCTKDQLKEIEDNEQIAINYCDKEGKTEEQFNPNGSIKNIAGIFNKEKNVLGMMPHPERMIDDSLSGEDGALFFSNLINNLK